MCLAGVSLVPGLPVLPLLVFVAEMCVVTLGTMRVIFISRGRKLMAPCLGFFEVVIWLFAIGQIMQNLSDLGCYLAFAGGFTTGNFLGVLLEKRLAIGTLVVRIITHKEASELMAGLKAAAFGVTGIDAQGATGPVTIILTVIKRKELPQVVAIIKDFDPRTFYSVEEIQVAASGIFPIARGRTRSGVPAALRLFRPAV